MGDGCSPHNIVGTIVASNQAKGRDLFSEAERFLEFSGSQRAYYERYMANEYGISKKNKGASSWDIIGKRSKNGSRPDAVDSRFYIPPSSQFKGKFFDSIDRKLTAWSKGKNPGLESYNKEVAPEIRKVIKAIDGIVQETETKAQMNTKLLKFGLNADNLYDARQYLDWLAKGGHLKSQGDAQPLLKLAGNISKAQANLNLKWTLGNGVDMLRVVSHYLTRKDGVSKTVEGLYKGFAASKGNPFQRIKSLEKAGVYHSIYMDRGGSNSLNPFEWSITAQKNLTYYLDKAAGGDGMTGIREQIFDYKPWDRPRYDRFEGSGLIAGLARYPINETRWLFRKTRDALSGDARSGAELGVYALSRAAFTGTTSLIPAFVWQAIPKEMREHMVEWENKTGQNLIKVVSRNVFQKFGVNVEFDLADYTRPLGGTIGARAESLVTTGNTAGKEGAKAGISLVKGKVPAAAAHAGASVLALANLGLLGAISQVYAPLVKPAEAVESSVLNSTTLRALFSTTGTEMDKEFNRERAKTNVVKALFGQSTVKKVKAAPDDTVSDLPDIK